MFIIPINRTFAEKKSTFSPDKFTSIRRSFQLQRLGIGTKRNRLFRQINLLVQEHHFNCKDREIGPKRNRPFRQINLLVIRRCREIGFKRNRLFRQINLLV